jgi:hypothetical protein
VSCIASTRLSSLYLIVNNYVDADTFCEVSLDRQKARTKTCIGGSTWNEPLMLLVENKTSIQSQNLVIQIFDQEFQSKTPLGSCTVPGVSTFSDGSTDFGPVCVVPFSNLRLSKRRSLSLMSFGMAA